MTTSWVACPAHAGVPPMYTSIYTWYMPLTAGIVNGNVTSCSNPVDVKGTFPEVDALVVESSPRKSSTSQDNPAGATVTANVAVFACPGEKIYIVIAS